MQVLLSQTTKKREEKQMKQITEYELKFMNMFIETGIQMLPNPDRSAYESDSDYEFIQFVSDRLVKFYALYKTPTIIEEGDKEW
jgi:hypothetical protein